MTPGHFKLTARMPAWRFTLATLWVAVSTLHARPWTFNGIPQPLEAEFVGMKDGGVVLQGPNGKSFEIPFTSFTPADQKYLRALDAAGGPVAVEATPGKPVTSSNGYRSKTVATFANEVVPLTGASELHVTGDGDPISGSTFNFNSPDAWLFLDAVAPSVVASKFLNRMRVAGKRATLDENIRVVQCGPGTVIIPHPPDFAAMTVYEGKSLAGTSLPLECYEKYDDAKLGRLKGAISSFVLKRGYMATVAQQEKARVSAGTMSPRTTIWWSTRCRPGWTTASVSSASSRGGG